MITVDIFTTFMYMDLAFILYAFWDNDNRNFTHVYAALISVVLSGMLAYYLILGVNEGAMVTVTDYAVAYFFVFLSVIMIIYTILSALEAASGAAHPEGVMEE